MNTFTTLSPWNRLVAYGEENRFGLICFALIIVGCLGGVTMELGAFQHTGLMILVLIPTMTTLSLLLAVSPVRLILIAFATAVLMDLIVGLVLTL
jgi:hypothetical protein